MSTALGLLSLVLAFAVIAAVASRRREVAAPLLAAFAARACLALIDAEVYLLPGQDDSFRFDFFAFYWSRNGLAGTFEHLGTGVALYTWLTSALYAIFDRSRLMMQGLNVLFGSLIVFNVWRLAFLVSQNARQARVAAWLVALFPSLIFFSSIMLREIAVAYPLSLGVYHLVAWNRTRKMHHGIVGVIALLASMAFHSGGFAVLLAAGVWLVGVSLRAAMRGQITLFLRSMVGLAAALIAVGFAVSSGFGMQKFHAVESGELADLGTTQGHFAKGRTAYLEDLRADSPADLLWQAPLRLSYFLFAPFPWMIRAGADLVGLVDSLFFLYLSLRAWSLRRSLREHPLALFVLGVFGAMAITFALGVSNYGTAHRHRNKMLPLLIAAVIALPKRQRGLTLAQPRRPLSVPPSRLLPAEQRARG